MAKANKKIKEAVSVEVELPASNEQMKKEETMSTAQNLNEVKFVRADGKAENGPLRIVKANELEANNQIGEVLRGTFLRTSISEKYGSASYIFGTEEGDVLINGCGSLNKQMSFVKEGDLVQVDYRGSAIIKEGKWKGTKSHLFTVLKASDMINESEG